MNKYSFMEKLGGESRNESTIVPPSLFIDCIDNTFSTSGLSLFYEGFVFTINQSLEKLQKCHQLVEYSTIFITTQYNIIIVFQKGICLKSHHHYATIESVSGYWMPILWRNGILCLIFWVRLL